MEDIVKAIKLLKPTAEFSFTNNDYSTIVWDVLEGDAPTVKELQAAIKQVKANDIAAADAAAAAKAALLARLGITADEAKLLIG